MLGAVTLQWCGVRVVITSFKVQRYWPQIFVGDFEGVCIALVSLEWAQMAYFNDV